MGNFHTRLIFSWNNFSDFFFLSFQSTTSITWNGACNWWPSFPTLLCQEKKTAKKKKNTKKRIPKRKKNCQDIFPSERPSLSYRCRLIFALHSFVRSFVRSVLVDKFCSYIDFDSFLLQHIMFNLFQSVLHQCWFYWTIFATAKRWAIVLPRDSFSLFISSFQLPLSLSTYAD